MTSYLIFFSLLISQAHAEIKTEKFVTIGHHNKETISLRVHKVKTGTGYSVIKTLENGKVRGHTMSKKNYVKFNGELEDLLKVMQQKPIHELTQCDDPLAVGFNKNGKTILSSICLERESARNRKKFINWWRRVSKKL
jgi:hypothetical protein